VAAFRRLQDLAYCGRVRFADGATPWQQCKIPNGGVSRSDPSRCRESGSPVARAVFLSVPARRRAETALQLVDTLDGCPGVGCPGVKKNAGSAGVG